MYYYTSDEYSLMMGLINDFFGEDPDVIAQIANYIQYNDTYGIYQVTNYDGWLAFLSGLTIEDEMNLGDFVTPPGWKDFGISGIGGGNL